jgi:DNA-directed RNA polymerase subunit RPC12/RpoP
MASCNTCGATILFGGRKLGAFRFCNDTCAQNGPLLSKAKELSEADVRVLATQIHGSKCPKCSGPGPVDVRASHQVWSALFFTRWKSTQQIACRKCGIKAQAGDLVISIVAGWWGFPWGLLITPIQVGRNIVGMAMVPSPTQPSAKLLQQARLMLARRHLLADRAGA